MRCDAMGSTVMGSRVRGVGAAFDSSRPPKMLSLLIFEAAIGGKPGLQRVVRRTHDRE